MRPINADALYRAYVNRGEVELTLSTVIREIEKQPTLDAMPMKHGQWDMGKGGHIYFCPYCDYFATPTEVRDWNFCPCCGARLDE